MMLKERIKRYLPNRFIDTYRKMRLEVRMRQHIKEVNRRKILDIFDYQELAADMPYVTREKYQNGFYGLDRIVKKYAGIAEGEILDGMIEHGLYYDNEVNPEETVGNNLWTLGEERRQYLGKYMDIAKVHSVGPYILYANDLYDDNKIKALKRKLGRMLLVFPSHSTHWIDVNFDMKDFVHEIRRIKNEYAFDSVMVSIYWKDILRGTAQFYEKEGFFVCTAGHMFDDNFLSRQRGIIKLADMCMGNRLGTHIGYCVALGKPYYHYYMDNEYEFHGEESPYDLHTDLNYRKELEYLLKKNFGTYHEDLTEDNLAFIKRYWGNF